MLNIYPQESAGHHISLQGGALGGSGANFVSSGENTADMKPLIIRHVTVGDKQFNIVVDERGIPSIAPLGILVVPNLSHLPSLHNLINLKLEIRY